MRAEPPFSNRFIYNLRHRHPRSIRSRTASRNWATAGTGPPRVLAAEPAAGARELPRYADHRERELALTLRGHPAASLVGMRRGLSTPRWHLQPEAPSLPHLLAQKGLSLNGRRTKGGRAMTGSPDWYRFAAADVLFFRDGRPLTRVTRRRWRSRPRLPPHPTTAGSVRCAPRSPAASAGAGPTVGEGRQRQGHNASLGDGANLKQSGLQFRGPYLVHGVAGPLFSSAGDAGTGEHRRSGAAPARSRLATTATSARVSASPNRSAPTGKVKSVTGAWLTREGMQRAQRRCAGARGDLSRHDDENDVAARRSPARSASASPATPRPAPPAGLLTPLVRPPAVGRGCCPRGRRQGLERSARAGEPDPLGRRGPVRVGGADRVACFARRTAVRALRACDEEDGAALLYTVTAITPLHLSGTGRDPGGALPGLPGTIVCACHERAVMAWRPGIEHFKEKDWGPQPLKAMLPAEARGSWRSMRARPRAMRYGNVWHPHWRVPGLGDGQILIGTCRMIMQTRRVSDERAASGEHASNPRVGS